MNTLRRALRPSPWLFSLLAGLAAYAVNGYGLAVFGGTRIVFGGVFTLLVTYRYGAVWGGLATAIGFSRAWIEWGQPWAFDCYVLEALIVGRLMHCRRLDPLVAAAVFWGVIGVPLTVMAVTLLQPLPFPVNWAETIKFPCNSLLMAMIALPVFHERRFRRWTGMPPDRATGTPLQAVLSMRFGFIIVVTIAVLGLVAGRIFDGTLRRLTADELANDSDELSSVLVSFLDRHLNALSLLASEDSARRMSADELATQLELLRRDNRGFLTVLAADASGRIVAAAPAAAADGAGVVPRGLSVADRDYFREPMRTGRPFVSQVFQGRGFGTDVIVAFSAPVRDAAGRPVMVLEGSLDVGRLPRAIDFAALLESRSLLILDQNRRVVASTGELARPSLSLGSGLPVAEAAREAAERASFVFDAANRGRRERFLGSQADVPRYGWQILLAEPLWHSEALIAKYYLIAAFWAALMIALALILARGTASDITAPLSELAVAMRQLSSQQPAKLPDEAAHSSRELTEISRELQWAAMKLSHSNGELAAAVTARDESNRQLLEARRDLEEKVRERTRQLEIAIDEAEAANHAKTEFLASMSHELRTPLNVILGMSELIGERALGPLTDKQAEGIQSVNESGRHLLSVINDILDLSKIEAGMLPINLQAADLESVCQASLRFVRESARKKDIALECDIRSEDGTILVDEQRLKQILVNLLSNAVKFTPAGGRVGLEVRQSAAPPAFRFVVWDTGIGIAAKDAARLFQPFQQIDSSLTRQYSGTGLGLALVKRMTQLHGGTVDLESAPGRGSRFGVTLPIGAPAAPEAAPAAPAPVSSAAASPPPLRILIAEDNEANVRVYDGYLGPRGHHLIVAGNGEEAVRLALAEQPDLVLMDVHMPVMDGLTAIRLLRADPRTAGLPIVAATALAMPEDRAKCLEAGATDYLSKPIILRELARVIARVTQAQAAPEPAPVA